MKPTHHLPRNRASRMRYLMGELSRCRITQSELAELSEMMREDKDRLELKQAFRHIDKKYGSRSKFVAQGGLPSLGKRRP